MVLDGTVSKVKINVRKYEKTFRDKYGKQRKYFEILKSKTWKCRKCANKTIDSDQAAGSGGPRGLRDGTQTRPSEKLRERIFSCYNYEDPISGRKLKKSECLPDHRVPRIRWSGSEPNHNDNMSEEDIKKKFQLLKVVKDDSNDNLLKSRACEECKETGIRGKIDGIDFFYEGDENWPEDVPEEGEAAEEGCVGCGWYDVAKWKEELNKKLQKQKKKKPTKKP